MAGKYELLERIGRGGMGSVWEARHATLGHKVAIKFIESDLASTEEARKRFDNEAKAAATIQSKHAIQIFDHGVTEDGKPFIVMERLTGEPLDKRLERVGRMSPQDVARIIQQVCRALHRAHEGGIVHRDLKPENIFLTRTPDDDEEIAKVLDFGIAKMRNPQDQGLSSSTKTGAVLGTPYYMSPEQARGLRSVDTRSDLWSLGVIAFKCVVGRLPFEGESLGDLLVKICTAPIPVPSQSLPGLPPAFDAWFFRALEREPTRRFQTAQELSDALAFACGVSVRRGPPSTMSTPAPPPPMSTTPTPYAAVPNVTSAPFTSPAEPVRPSGNSAGIVIASVLAAVVGLGFGGYGIYYLRARATPPPPTTSTAPVPTAVITAPTTAVDTLPTLTPPASTQEPTTTARPTVKPATPPTTKPTASTAPVTSTKPTATASATVAPTTTTTGTTHLGGCNGCGF